MALSRDDKIGLLALGVVLFVVYPLVMIWAMHVDPFTGLITLLGMALVALAGWFFLFRPRR